MLCCHPLGTILVYPFTDHIQDVQLPRCPGTIEGDFLSLSCEVKWHSGFKDMLDILLTDERVNRSPNLIVPVLVYSANTKITDEEELKEILIKAKNITELFPTVVITHQLSKHLPDTQKKFRRMGVEHIFPVENYTEEDYMRTRGKHEGILKCLYEIIKDVEFRMSYTRDPVAEKIGRKRFLYEFAYNRDMEKERERTERTVRIKLEEEKIMRRLSERRNGERCDRHGIKDCPSFDCVIKRIFYK
ncbi:uncharacterized protein [Dendropsophus ebraccatus]|uniref:uncharacterized protein n=1 Tax=Dendropsophus ebraccatus TaxID=150705 RepID=UPI003831DFBB